MRSEVVGRGPLIHWEKPQNTGTKLRGDYKYTQFCLPLFTWGTPKWNTGQSLYSKLVPELPRHQTPKAHPVVGGDTEEQTL